MLLNILYLENQACYIQGSSKRKCPQDSSSFWWPSCPGIESSYLCIPHMPLYVSLCPNPLSHEDVSVLEEGPKDLFNLTPVKTLFPNWASFWGDGGGGAETQNSTDLPGA